MIKVFGIGNILLCDDAIGVRILEKLIDPIKSLSPHIEGIIGETDCYFCMDCIDKDDFIIIIDSTYLDLEPGTISYLPFSECDTFIKTTHSAHEMNLLKMLRSEYPEIQGFLIGIEISRIDFSLELSPTLHTKFDEICKQILLFLEKVVKVYA